MRCVVTSNIFQDMLIIKSLQWEIIPTDNYVQKYREVDHD